MVNPIKITIFAYYLFLVYMDRTKSRNRPIATVIKNYLDKKSGKVTESRNEIQRRFFGLDWKDQKRIMSAFLDSGKSDRDWAYSRLLDLWDSSFQEQIKGLWDEYHEFRCAGIIIRHFPLDYIRENMDQFKEDRDYYFICLRLAKGKDYMIERAKLSKTDYLAVLYHTEREITDDDARDTLYGIVHDCCFCDSFLARLEHLGEGRRGNLVTPANYRDVNLAIYYLLRLDKEDVVQQFREWNEKVEDAIYNSPEFKAFQRLPYSSYDEERKGIELANLYAYMALDDNYKMPSDPSVDELRKKVDDRLNWAKKQQELSARGGDLFPIFGTSIDGGIHDKGEEDLLPF